MLELCIPVKRVVSDSDVQSMSSHGGKRHGSGRGIFPLGYFFTNARDREAEYLSKWQRSSKKAYLDQKVRELGDACVYDICTIFTLALELRRRAN